MRDFWLKLIRRAIASRPRGAEQPQRHEITARELMADTIIVLVAIFAVGWLLVNAGATSSSSHYIFYQVDVPGFSAVAISLLAVALIVRRSHRVLLFEKTPIILIAFAVLVVTGIGVLVVDHNFALTGDEWMPRLQAQIFIHGELAGRVPPEWRDYGQAIYHPFVFYDRETGRVASSYRPGMAALIALFDLAGVGLFVSAFMTAGAVWLTASLARILWPESATAPIIAALLVASSSQALAAAMTTYAMSAHLFFNLLWLRLFLLNTPRGHFAAAICGIATASLHQVHMHAFYAAPFFILLLRPFRPGVLLWYATVYFLGHLAVMDWDAFAIGGAASSGLHGTGLNRTFSILSAIAHLPTLLDLAAVATNLMRFISWQSLALVPLLFFAAKRHVWSLLLVLVVASIASSLLPYIFLMPDQGAGWGYRYLHGLIGSVALIGTAGWVELERKQSGEIRETVVLCFAFTFCVVVPVRAYLIEKTIAPWWKASKAAEALHADVVLVDDLTILYGINIPRMDPYTTQRPVVMMMAPLSIDQIRHLCSNYRVAYFGATEGRTAGILTRTAEEAVTHAANGGEFDAAEMEIVSNNYMEKYDLLTSGSCRSMLRNTAH